MLYEVITKVLAGEYLGEDVSGVLVEQHMAEHFGLTVGDARDGLTVHGVQLVDRPIRRDPTLERGSEEAGFEEIGEAGGQGELPIGDGQPQASGAERPRRIPPGPKPDKIVTLFLLARDNHVITGAELLDAALKTGMEFGDMNIFHRTADGSDRNNFV